MKLELLILLYDSLSRNNDDFVEYLFRRIGFKISELDSITGKKEYSEIIKYLRKK